MDDDFSSKNIVISLAPEIIREAALAFTDKDLSDEQVIAVQDFIESCIWDSVTEAYDEALYQIICNPYYQGIAND